MRKIRHRATTPLLPHCTALTGAGTPMRTLIQVNRGVGTLSWRLITDNHTQKDGNDRREPQRQTRATTTDESHNDRREPQRQAERSMAEPGLSIVTGKMTRDGSRHKALKQGYRRIWWGSIVNAGDKTALKRYTGFVCRSKYITSLPCFALHYWVCGTEQDCDMSHINARRWRVC